ncbi:MAG: hypothetical protein ACRBF0_13160 [Calditrichia bacterium]
MKQSIMTLMLLIIGLSCAVAQNDWPTFKKNSEKFYHYVADEQVENFSFLLTSRSFVDYMDQVADSNFTYPLKAIWVRNRGNYYILQPLPTQDDSLRRNTLTRIQFMKNFYSGTQEDWHKFCFSSPLADLDEKAEVVFANDTVSAVLKYNEQGVAGYERRTFTAGGQLGRVVWQLNDQRIITTPFYEEINNKWLCVGWRSQMYTAGEVTSGLQASVLYTEIDERILPESIVTTIQSVNDPGASSRITLYLKDFVFNEQLEVLKPEEKPSDGAN